MEQWSLQWSHESFHVIDAYICALFELKLCLLLWNFIPPFHISTRFICCGTNKVLLPEAVARKWSVKKVFSEISQNSQKNICVRASFLIELQASDNFSFTNLPCYFSFACLLCFIRTRLKFCQKWRHIKSRIQYSVIRLITGNEAAFYESLNSYEYAPKNRGAFRPQPQLNIVLFAKIVNGCQLKKE